MVICAKTPSDSQAVYTFLQTKYTQLQCFRRLIQTFTVLRRGRRTVTSGFQFKVTELPSWRSWSWNTHGALVLWAPLRQEVRAWRTACASVTQSGRGSSLPPGTIRDVLPSGSAWTPSCMSTGEQAEFDMDLTLTLSFFRVLAVVYGEKFSW